MGEQILAAAMADVFETILIVVAALWGSLAFLALLARR